MQPSKLWKKIWPGMFIWPKLSRPAILILNLPKCLVSKYMANVHFAVRRVVLLSIKQVCPKGCKKTRSNDLRFSTQLLTAWRLALNEGPFINHIIILKRVGEVQKIVIWDYFQAGKQSIAGFTRGERGSKNFQIGVTLFIDDPQLECRIIASNTY